MLGRSVAERTLKLALDLVFPPRCELCGRGGTLLCDACAGGLRRTEGQRCERCWAPALGAHCRYCQEEPPSYLSLRAPFVMESGARDLVHALKYRGYTSLGEPMGALLARAAGRPAADVVVPVPLHGSRQRSRGYNQATYLARIVATTWALPVDERAVRRVRATAQLAKTMHRDERRAIVAGAFAASASLVAGTRVLLVDDVATTGATLDACASALIDAGARSVSCVTFARAD